MKFTALVPASMKLSPLTNSNTGRRRWVRRRRRRRVFRRRGTNT